MTAIRTTLAMIWAGAKEDGLMKLGRIPGGGVCIGVCARSAPEGISNAIAEQCFLNQKK